MFQKREGYTFLTSGFPHEKDEMHRKFGVSMQVFL
jgi:hypothetical protein